MTQDRITAVLDALPARASALINRLGMSHEETYAALVHLEARGLAFVCVQTPRGSRRSVHWEPV